MNRKILFLALLLVFGYLVLTLALQTKIKSVLRVPATTPAPAAKTGNVSYACEKGRTAFELLEERTQSVEVKEYSFGKLVTAIDGLQNGTDGNFWTYFVNDKAATIGAEAFKCEDQEKVEWRFGREEAAP